MPSLPASDFSRRQRAKYVLRPGFLDAEKRKALHLRIPQDSPVETFAGVESGVKSGEFQLFDVYQDGKRIGFTVSTVTEGDAGRELLSIASYSDGGKGADVTGGAMPILEKIAQEQGCTGIRLHTMRTGLVEKLIPEGWYVSEIVMRKNLSNA